MRSDFSRAGRFAFAACAVAVATPALAQEGENEEIVVTAQRENQSEVTREGNVGVLGERAAEDVPFSIRSYNAALILNQQPQTLGQLLENDPTIRTTYGFGIAGEQFVIRGFPLSGDDVGLDGLYGIAPRQLVAPELYQSIQVLNGASAFLNGAAPGGSGIGGSVNLIFKRADRDLARATLGYTSDAHFGGAFDFGRRFSNGAIGVRVNGAFRSGDVSIDDEFRRTAVIGGAFDYDRGPLRLSLDLAYQRVEVDRLRHKVTLATSVVPEVPDASHNYAQPWTYTTLRDVFGVARLEYDLAPNALLYAVLGARDGSEDGIYGGITVTDAATGAATGTALFVPRSDNNEAAQVGVRLNLAAGGVTQEFNIGGSINWQVNRNAFDFLYGPGFAGFATNLYDTPVVPIPSSTLVGGDLDDPFPISRSRLYSVYASDTIGLLEGAVLFTPGLRLQAIRQRGYSYFDGSLASEYDESAVTPVFGLVVKPVDGVSLFANRIDGLAQGPTAPLEATLINPGEIFPPFRSTQYEVGGKLALDRFNASIALYTIDLPSAYAIPDPGGSGLDRFGIYGTQRNRGIEFTVDGEPIDGLRLIAGASINDATLRNTADGLNEGNEATGVPDYLVNANLEWDLPFAPALTVTGRVVHTGPQQVDAANTLRLESWTRVDIGARYVAVVGDMPLTLRFNVDNVADERYWASSFDSFSPQLLQGAPRTFKASATVDF